MDHPQPPIDYTKQPDLFTGSAILYQYAQIALEHLMSRLADPLPYALFTETDFTEEGAARALAVHDGPSLAQLMHEHLADMFHLLLVGHLVLDGPLGYRILSGQPELLETLPLVLTNLDDLRRITVNTAVGHYRYAATPADDDEQQADKRQGLQEYEDKIRQLFADLGHTLGSQLPLGPPAVAPVVWGTYPMSGLEAPALHTMLLAFRALPLQSAQPLARAVLRLPGYHPQRLDKLSAKLAKLRVLPGRRVRVTLTEWQALAAYQAMRIIGYTLVSGEGYDEGGLDDFLLRDSAPGLMRTVPPAQFAWMRRNQAAAADGFIGLITDTMGEHPDFRAVRAQVDALLDT